MDFHATWGLPWQLSHSNVTFDVLGVACNFSSVGNLGVLLPPVGFPLLVWIEVQISFDDQVPVALNIRRCQSLWHV